MIYKQSSLGNGDVYATVKFPFTNRTGATMYKGQIGLLDLMGTQSESTSLVPGESGYRYGNVTPCTQPKLDWGHPAVVCMEETLADNATGFFCLEGIVEVAVADDDACTTLVDKGDAVVVLVTGSAVAVEGWVTGAPSGGTAPRTVGIALEDAAADSNNTDRTINATSHRRLVHWFGGRPGGVSDT